MNKLKSKQISRGLRVRTAFNVNVPAQFHHGLTKSSAPASEEAAKQGAHQHSGVVGHTGANQSHQQLSDHSRPHIVTQRPATSSPTANLGKNKWFRVLASGPVNSRARRKVACFEETILLQGENIKATCLRRALCWKARSIRVTLRRDLQGT